MNILTIVNCVLFVNFFLTHISAKNISEIQISTKKSSNSTNTIKVSLKDASKPNITAQETTITHNESMHRGREHITSKPELEIVGNHKISNSTNTTIKLIPVTENSTLYDIPMEKNDDKKSVPKKGVNFNDIPTKLDFNKTVNKVKKIKKPLITEAIDDDPFAPSHFNVNSKINGTQSVNHKVPSLEYVTEKRNHKKADYIVPIVAVILSVPLVAIIISVLYKRGAEWWQHRHYRRMDFLIEGMYNS